MSQIIRKGALLSIGGLSTGQIAEYRMQYGTDQSDKAALKINEILEGLFSLCEKDPEKTTDMESITQLLGISRGTVLARCAELIKAGNMTKGLAEKPADGSKRSSTIYTLNPLYRDPPQQELLDLGAEDGYPECDGELLAADKDSFVLDANTNNWKADRFSTLSLLALFPGSTKSTLRKEGFETTIHINAAKMLVRVKPVVGYLCPCVLDLRALSAVITIAARRIKAGIQTENPFRISLKEILQQLGLPNESSRKILLYDSLKRFEFTRINVLKATSEFAEKFPEYAGLSCEVDEPIVFIDKIKTFSFTTPKGITPEIIDISFDDELLASISSKQQNLLSLHPESMVERNPFAFRLYLWLRRAVQHRGSDKALKITEEKLKRELEPNRIPTSFRRDMKAFLQQHNREGRGYSRYMGYCIQLLPGRIYAFWAAENDPLIGIRSYRANFCLDKKKEIEAD